MRVQNEFFLAIPGFLRNVSNRSSFFIDVFELSHEKPDMNRERNTNGNPHFISRALDIIACYISGYPTLHNPVCGGQVPWWLWNVPNSTYCRSMISRFVYEFK